MAAFVSVFAVLALLGATTYVAQTVRQARREGSRPTLAALRATLRIVGSYLLVMPEIVLYVLGIVVALVWQFV